MDHVAIMKKSWGLIPKILNGKKTIESRWYLTKKPPFGKIKIGETIYFKNSGEPVTAKVTVAAVRQFENLNSRKVSAIIDEFGGEGKICLGNKNKARDLFSKKKYCVLVFIKDPKKIRPFNIDKSGYGLMSAWISLNRIEQIKT